MARNNLRESPRKPPPKITATERRAGQFSEIKINGHVGNSKYRAFYLETSCVDWDKKWKGNIVKLSFPPSSCNILCFGEDESDFFFLQQQQSYICYSFVCTAQTSAEEPQQVKRCRTSTSSAPTLAKKGTSSEQPCSGRHKDVRWWKRGCCSSRRVSLRTWTSPTAWRRETTN